MLYSAGLQSYRASGEPAINANDVTYNRFHAVYEYQDAKKKKNDNYFLTIPVIDHCSLIFCFFFIFLIVVKFITLLSISRKNFISKLM